MSETASARGLEEDPVHHAPIVRRPADHPGLEGRFGNVTRMVFHPTPNVRTSRTPGSSPIGRERAFAARARLRAALVCARG